MRWVQLDGGSLERRPNASKKRSAPANRSRSEVEVFEQVGFTEFRFVDAHVAPGADPAAFRDFLEDCPICGISAVRPAGG